MTNIPNIFQIHLVTDECRGRNILQVREKMGYNEVERLPANGAKPVFAGWGKHSYQNVVTLLHEKTFR